MPRLDEHALRKEGFQEGVAIQLGDGHEWHFPKPVLELTPTVAPDGSYKFSDKFIPFGSEEFDAKVDAYIQAEGVEELNCLLSLAVDLLSRNYELTLEHYRALLPFRPGDDQAHDMWQQIGDVALGRGPKATAGGSEPAA